MYLSPIRKIALTFLALIFCAQIFRIVRSLDETHESDVFCQLFLRHPDDIYSTNSTNSTISGISGVSVVNVIWLPQKKLF